LQNDGVVGRYSSHLGTVIRSDYPLDHLGTLGPASGQNARRLDPVDLYVQHAARLKKAGL
jgi:triacylglycerol lipase